MPEPSFTLAPGHPDALFAAADWHEGVAAGLWEHAGTIRASAGSALAVWQGEAATAYQGLASTMAFSFETASNQSSEAAGIYRQVAREVDRCQQEGRVALTQAERWCEQVTTDNQRVTAAEAAIAVAQQDLEHVQQEMTRWDRRGQQLFEEAEHAVEQVTGLPLSIEPPPMPGAITGPFSPLTKAPADMQHHSSSVLGKVLGVIQDAANVVSTVGGACTSTLFWVPDVGEGCAVAAGAGGLVSAVTGVTQAATHNGSWGAAEVDVGGAVAGVAGGKLASVGKRLVDDGEDAEKVAKGSGAIVINRGRTAQAVNGALNGAGAAVSAGSLTGTLAGHSGRRH